MVRSSKESWRLSVEYAGGHGGTNIFASVSFSKVAFHFAAGSLRCRVEAVVLKEARLTS